MHHDPARRHAIARWVAGAAAAAGTGAARAQAPDAQALLEAQRAAMQPLAGLDGQWRGSARVMLPGGRTLELVQTERIGPMLGGSVKVIEGLGYDADGKAQFNAFGVISYTPASASYQFHSWAQGQSMDFALEMRPDGFVWWKRFGPVTVRQTAVVQGDRWIGLGERTMEGQPTVRTVEMQLRRIGPSDWPAAGAVPAR